MYVRGCPRSCGIPHPGLRIILPLLVNGVDPQFFPSNVTKSGLWYPSSETVMGMRGWGLGVAVLVRLGMGPSLGVGYDSREVLPG